MYQVFRRGQIKASITKFQTFLDEFTDSPLNQAKLQQRIENLKTVFKALPDITAQLMASNPDGDHATIETELTEVYMDVLAAATLLQHNYTETSNTRSVTPAISVASSNQNLDHSLSRMPKRELRKFDGKIEEWKSFSHWFKSNVHDRIGISDSTRMSYLQDTLVGEAASTIAGLKATNENYKEAWDLLETTYNNEEAIISRHFELLVAIPKIQDNSGESIRQLVNETLVHVRGMKVLGEPTDQWNTPLLYHTISKLDNTSKQEWYQRKVDKTKRSFDDLIDFLREEAMKIQTNTQKNNSNPTIKQNHIKNNQGNNNDEEKDDGLVVTSSSKTNSVVLLNRGKVEEIMVTALINILDKNDQPIRCRTLLDTAATSNLITESLAESLQLQKQKYSLAIGGLGDIQTSTSFKVKATIQSRFNNFERSLELYTVPEITKQHPNNYIDKRKLKLSDKINLADPTFNVPGNIDLLIGAGPALASFIPGHKDMSIPEGPDLFLQNTQFGWVIGGAISLNNQSSNIKTKQKDITCYITTIQALQELTQTWAIENGPKLEQLAEDKKQDFPEAAKIVKEEFYVDDLITGMNSIPKAMKIRNDLTQLLQRGGFNIRQWASNEPQVLEGLAEEEINKNLHIETDPKLKTLGLYWQTQSDLLIYESNKLPVNATVRIILAEIVNIILAARLILQECWRQEVTWDQELPKDIQIAWRKFTTEFNNTSSMNYNRSLVSLNTCDLQLHGFSDASEKAYGACIYLRRITTSWEVQTNLLCVKSKVAPLQIQTLARLELCAALMIANLYESISELLPVQVSNMTFWSDSTITLSWIKTPPYQHKTSWQLIQKLKQAFWKRWHKEYLNGLNIRHKCQKGFHEIKEGTIVIIKEDNTRPLHWPIGQVIQAHPGSDGIIRTVSIRTSYGVIDRNVRRLAILLPNDRPNESN